MNQQQQDFVYQLLKSMESGAIAASVAGDRMSLDAGLNRTSADILIYVYRHMISGEEYKRALNASDCEYLLQRIGEDRGAAGLALALQAFRLHIAYRERGAVAQHTNRQILERQELRLRQMNLSLAQPVVDLHALNEQFESAVRTSQAGGAEKRRARLRAASGRPQRVVRSVMIFMRNPDVVAEVLHRANGTCEACHRGAPFQRRSDGSPYLEVHHKVPLSEDGDDTVENAIALCPNCHRSKHFGPIEAWSDES